MTTETESAPKLIRRRRAPVAAALDVGFNEAEQEQEAPAEVEEVVVRPADEVRNSLRAMAAQLNGTFIQRGHAIDAIILANLTGMNYLLVGGPGTAKTALAESASKHFRGARFFAPSALGAYTTLSDLVGERDIPSLMQGVSKRQLRGKLASVELAFLDELFKASDPTCNTLLSLFNERRFEGMQTPLWSVGSASNWPEVLSMKPVVRAFWDRLHFRVVVEDVTEKAALKKMLSTGASLARVPYAAELKACVTMDEIRSVSKEIRKVAITEDTQAMLISVFERLANEKISISSRRLVQLQQVLQASAWMQGRTSTSIADFKHLIWCCWTRKEDIQKVKAVLDTVDAEYARNITKAINEARQMHNDFQGRGWSVDRAHEFLTKSTEVGESVAEVLASGNLSKTTDADVRRAVKLLKGEVEAVLKRYGEELGI
jgi:MoxR-like ATPase